MTTYDEHTPLWMVSAHRIVTEWRKRTPNGQHIPDAACRDLLWMIAFAIRDGKHSEMPPLVPEDTP